MKVYIKYFAIFLLFAILISVAVYGYKNRDIFLKTLNPKPQVVENTEPVNLSNYKNKFFMDETVPNFSLERDFSWQFTPFQPVVESISKENKDVYINVAYKGYNQEERKMRVLAFREGSSFKVKLNKTLKLNRLNWNPVFVDSSEINSEDMVRANFKRGQQISMLIVTVAPGLRVGAEKDKLTEAYCSTLITKYKTDLCEMVRVIDAFEDYTYDFEAQGYTYNGYGVPFLISLENI